MNVFDAWLIVVGLAIGAGLAWLVMFDLRRRDDDIAAREMHSEATWIAETLRSRDVTADPEAVEEVLRLHRAYLAGIPDEQASPVRRPAWAEVAYDDGDELDDLTDEDLEVQHPPAKAAPPIAAPAPAAASAAAAPAVANVTDGEALEPAWAEDDLKAAHEALDVLLNKAPPTD